jgi:hypothetical protein
MAIDPAYQRAQAAEAGQEVNAHPGLNHDIERVGPRSRRGIRQVDPVA